MGARYAFHEVRTEPSYIPSTNKRQQLASDTALGRSVPATAVRPPCTRIRPTAPPLPPRGSYHAPWPSPCPLSIYLWNGAADQI
jgi:hypothetical protein